VVVPRYFTPRAGRDAKDAPGGLLYAIDTFTLRTGGAGTEWIVGVDHAGEFAVQRLEAFDALPAQIRSALAYHEVSGGARRVIALDSLFVFEMRLLEQTPDCPGVNDPVRLYGTLVGPLTSDTSVDGGPIRRLEGQLTVTRGDLLAGLVAGARWAFHCAEANGERSARAFSMLMGADRYHEVAAGQGAVIAYPMLGLDGDLYAQTPGNEEIVSRVLYDLLHAWWTDVAREAPPAFREPDALPVPNRPQVEQQLRREGFAIKGDVAVRTKAGLAGALPGALGRESRHLPREGATNDFLKLAVEALAKAPEWPSPSVEFLSGRVRNASEVDRPAAPAPLRAARSADFAGRAVPEWMQELIGARAQPPPVLTPGPNDPSAPRKLRPIDAAATATANAALDLLASRFGAADDV